MMTAIPAIIKAGTTNDQPHSFAVAQKDGITVPRMLPSDVWVFHSPRRNPRLEERGVPVTPSSTSLMSLKVCNRGRFALRRVLHFALLWCFTSAFYTSFTTEKPFWVIHCESVQRLVSQSIYFYVPLFPKPVSHHCHHSRPPSRLRNGNERWKNEIETSITTLREWSPDLSHSIVPASLLQRSAFQWSSQCGECGQSEPRPPMQR